MDGLEPSANLAHREPIAFSASFTIIDRLVFYLLKYIYHLNIKNRVAGFSPTDPIF